LGGEKIEEEEEVGGVEAVVEGEERLNEGDETRSGEKEGVQDGFKVGRAAADGDEGLSQVVPKRGVEGEGGYTAGKEAGD